TGACRWRHKSCGTAAPPSPRSRPRSATSPRPPFHARSKRPSVRHRQRGDVPGVRPRRRPRVPGASCAVYKPNTPAYGQNIRTDLPTGGYTSIVVCAANTTRTKPHERLTRVGVVMITREEALRRLDAVAHELVALRAALAEGWTETPSANSISMTRTSMT